MNGMWDLPHPQMRTRQDPVELRRHWDEEDGSHVDDEGFAASSAAYVKQALFYNLDR